MKIPKHTVITKFGGDSAVAKIVGRHRSSIVRWRKNGRIPAEFQQLLLSEGKRAGIDITPYDFFDPE